MESYKQQHSLTGKQVAELFDKYGVYDYINEFYDILHTTSEDYVNYDIDKYLKARISSESI